MAGYGTFRYSAQAPVITIQGFTGIAGVDGIDRLRKFRALPGVVPTLLPFRYPARWGEQAHYVWLNSFEDSIDDTLHLYNQFSISMVEFPLNSVPTVRVLSSTLGSDLAAIIHSGPPPLAASPGGGNTSAQVNPSYNTTYVPGSGNPAAARP